MSKTSPTKEIKLLTIEEVDFNLPEIEPTTQKPKDKKDKKLLTEKYTDEPKEKKEKKNNRIKR
jgi:hypothetical protein